MLASAKRVRISCGPRSRCPCSSSRIAARVCARHLDRLLQITALQEAGRSLDEIRQAIGEGSGPGAVPVTTPPPIPREVWRRLTVAPGVELHVSGDVRLPSPGRLQELAAWCRLHFGNRDSNEDDDA